AAGERPQSARSARKALQRGSPFVLQLYRARAGLYRGRRGQRRAGAQTVDGGAHQGSAGRSRGIDYFTPHSASLLAEVVAKNLKTSKTSGAPEEMPSFLYTVGLVACIAQNLTPGPSPQAERGDRR